MYNLPIQETTIPDPFLLPSCNRVLIALGGRGAYLTLTRTLPTVGPRLAALLLPDRFGAGRSCVTWFINRRFPPTPGWSM